MKFNDKEEARAHVWDRLSEIGAARFPFVPRRRIPNFSGADKAAKRLAEHPMFKEAQVVKINPDSPQRPLREMALRMGKTVVVPTPRLSKGFLIFRPSEIDEENYRDASMISRWGPFSKAVPLEKLPQVDLIVTGSVAVTKTGRRVGKGHGYSDLEYAILRELGHRGAPVATTVHDEQVVEEVPAEAHDLRLDLVVTPGETWECGEGRGGPEGIDWELLSEEDLEAMPVLARLNEMGLS